MASDAVNERGDLGLPMVYASPAIEYVEQLAEMLSASDCANFSGDEGCSEGKPNS
jgi:hypothetical protein